MMIFNYNKEDLAQLFIYKRWIWHVVFWSIFFILETPSYFFAEHQPVDFWELALIQDVSILLLSYSIIFICFPLFYNKKKYLFFILSIILNAMFFNILIAYLIKDKINDYISKVSSLPQITLLEAFLQGLSISTLFSIFIVMAKLIKAVFIKQYHDNQRKKLQMQSELNNLKAQLSPHFLFNTMNNFYGLAVEKSSKLPKLMLRLSDLMRYSLYETKNEKVSLLNEVNFLLNYIELEKIRLEDTLQVSFNFDNEKIKNYTIAPLILIVFVENAFKHSRNTDNEIIKINIDLNITIDNWLYFEVKNNNHNKNQDSNILERTGGIGIDNVKKRLDVLYPNGMYNLTIDSLDSLYKIYLKINLLANE